jgi:hypothetical protein
MENRTCQNCHTDFTIEPDDFSFYEKVKVPPPTFCPECRLQRRYAWRNERSFFKTICGHCGKNILSAYPSESSYPIFCHNCWMGDAWDPLDYGQEYDFTKPFFTQFKELFGKVPRLNLFQMNSANSEYSNIIRDCKNTYLSYSITNNSEDIYYSKNVDKSKQIIDCLGINDCEKSAHLVYGANAYGVVFSVITRSCLNSSFLFDCHGCSDCFMSSNLRNKKYIFRNKQLSKEEYEEKIAQINFGSNKNFSELVKEFEELKMNAIHRYADIVRSVHATGNALGNVKNAQECFEAYDMENVKWVSRSYAIKDSMDVVNTGIGSELVYEYASGGAHLQKVIGCVAALNPLSDAYYSGWCGSSSDLFGCFGLRSKKFCILNKQYTEEEYKKMVPKVIDHMNQMPYEGENGRVYGFGEFFPIELSPFAYNDSTSQEMWPLSKEEIKLRGYAYREPEIKNYTITIGPENLPDDINEVTENITNEIIGCEHAGNCLHQCTTAFKITAEELSFYKQFNLPLPRMCPNCRHYKRLEYRNPWKLWHRSCVCDIAGHDHEDKCQNEFETSYAPDRPEKVYCETCYQKEVL